MRQSLDSLDLPSDQRDTLWDYLERAAYFMVNSLSE
jgi:hemoglobin